MSYFLVDCEAPLSVASPVIEPLTECGIVLFDQPPFSTSYHFRRGGDVADMAAWIHSTSIGYPVFVSDNPAYDWQWLAAEFAKANIINPFGHSGRRIGDFAAGLANNFRDVNYWKRYRKTPHDHNPVNDARGNAEALWRLGVVPHPLPPRDPIPVDPSFTIPIIGDMLLGPDRPPLRIRRVRRRAVSPASINTSTNPPDSTVL